METILRPVGFAVRVKTGKRRDFEKHYAVFQFGDSFMCRAPETSVEGKTCRQKESRGFPPTPFFIASPGQIFHKDVTKLRNSSKKRSKRHDLIGKKNLVGSRVSCRRPPREIICPLLLPICFLFDGCLFFPLLFASCILSKEVWAAVRHKVVASKRRIL